MKKLFTLFLIVFLLTFVACKPKDLTIDTAKEYFNQTMETYSKASKCEFKVTLVNGEETTKIAVKYEFTDGKVTKLNALATDSVGNISVLINNGNVILQRYSSPAQTTTLTDAEALTIAESYGFDAYMERVLDVYSSAFFLASEIESTSTDLIKLNLNLDALELPEDIDVDKIISMQEDIDALKEMKEVKLELTVSENTVTKLYGTYTNSKDVFSSITIEFVSVNKEISLESSAIYG